MRKRQRISLEFNVRKPKLQINHSISKNVNRIKDDINVVNNPYLAHTLETSSSSQSNSISPPPPPSPPPLPPPPPIITDTSSSLNYLLNYEDSSSESETENNIVENESEKENNKDKENEIKIPVNENKKNLDLMNSFETFLSEINELESNSNTNSEIPTNTENTSINNNKNEPTLTIVKNGTIFKNENNTIKNNTAENSYHESSIMIINKLAYLASDKSIIYTTTSPQDYQYHQIEFSTRYKDWSVGALNFDYFKNYHNEINNLLIQIEDYFSPPGWIIKWDSNNLLYYYENKKSKIISHEYPKVTEIEQPNQIYKSDDNDEENMELESDNETTYTKISKSESLKNKNKEEKPRKHKTKKATTIKDKNMLKLMQKWKEVEDSLNSDDSNDEDEKISKWAEEQRNKVDSNENPNFEPISSNWREKILKRNELENNS
ncbi:hypothetical protein BCR36DRAFT_407428 [Piromyces finnis]|uniref:WW domain-containing protein n=1 Tax=Piromyces finnis TaxID=1754191 RepID=A0A1Y1UVM5_9FUNG|nr:hypothetical protein BCR36DRAFT_407428 [Piromyces finnis]|eukprot:ORX41660.1 hypothetical protein BCR36DRAFT_407428 [Piromyces finnis]